MANKNILKINSNKSLTNKRPYFSHAVMKLARANLKKYEEEADEAFLVRSEINRKLNKY
jgi:hypothetical protein